MKTIGGWAETVLFSLISVYFYAHQLGQEWLDETWSHQEMALTGNRTLRLNVDNAALYHLNNLFSPLIFFCLRRIGGLLVGVDLF